MASAHFDGKITEQTPLKVTFPTWAQRRRPWRFHGIFGYIRPWVLKLRCVQMKLSRVLHGEITKRLQVTYTNIAAAVATNVTRDINCSALDEFQSDPCEHTIRRHFKAIKSLIPRRSTKPLTLRICMGSPHVLNVKKMRRHQITLQKCLVSLGRRSNRLSKKRGRHSANTW